VTTIQRHSHRNGVCGLRFDCWIEAERLVIQFEGGQPIDVPFAMLDTMLGLKGKGRYREPYAGLSGWVKDVQHDTRPGIDRTFVAYTDGKQRLVAILDRTLHTETEPAFAAFDFDLLPDLTFGINSWRGDNHYNAVRSYL
jgi:hypothetical protein